MSPIALKYLKYAFEHYLQTSNKDYSYRFSDANDMFNAICAVRQLYEYGYIDNVSEYTIKEPITVSSDIINYSLTDLAINYMRRNREL